MSASGMHVGPCDLTTPQRAQLPYLHRRGFLTIGAETLQELENVGFDTERLKELPPYEVDPGSWWAAVHSWGLV